MAHSPTPAVIFDLDGTLVDSEPHYYEAGRLLLARHGVADFTWREHLEFVGIGTRETLATLRRRHRLAAPVDQLLREKNEIYLDLARRGTAVFPGMRTLLERLHEAGHPLIVASGSSAGAIEAVLGGTGLLPLLPRFVSAEEVGRGKPAPDVFVEAARRLGVRPTRCAVVEDAVPGVQAARSAGMRRIVVPYAAPDRLEADTPDAAAHEGGVPGGPAEGRAPGSGVRESFEELVFPGGQREFDPDRAYGWLLREG
ncbi:HAD family phosphatase [Streptomyces sp. XM4193]|uniref:HAD family hydrolase n=1 Tax=Streptomyces sp. XM4193 TaxID=2929782 RepID=UPI001FF8D19C|nr:HAD family phosphatase [Streptomyces sp. XM4193]MCK1797753.1 HAD family phosphatase [Streptomyces sp. XM4193]